MGHGDLLPNQSMMFCDGWHVRKLCCMQTIMQKKFNQGFTIVVAFTFTVGLQLLSSASSSSIDLMPNFEFKSPHINS